MVQVCRGYVRVSTEEQAEEGYSLEAQDNSIRQFAQERGWTLAGIYADEGLSAKDTKRPALQKLLKELGRGEVLVAWKLDRLTRSVLDSETLFKQLDKRQAQFVSIMEPYLSTTGAGGTMVRQITAVFAEFYRAQLGENVRHGMAQVARQGRWTGGPLPYGYDYHGGSLVINPEQADVVRRIFSRYLAGYGVRAIAIELNEQGLRTSKGAVWSPYTISYLLRNPLYCGKVGFGKRGAYRQAGRTIIAVGQHDAIVPVEQWEAAQSVMERRKTLPSRTAGGHYPLTGIAVCGLCGAAVSGTLYTDGDKPEKRRVYRCSYRHHTKLCRLPHMGADKLEQAVLDALVPQIDRLLVNARLDANTAPPANRGDAEKQLADVKRRLERARAAYLGGVMDLGEYSSVVKPLKEHRASLERQTADGNHSAVRELERIQQLAAAIPAVWTNATPAERKELLHSAGLRIIVHPGYQVELQKA